MQRLLHRFHEAAKDYSSVKVLGRDELRFCIIVPVHNRNQYVQACANAWTEAIKYYKLNVVIVFVEQDFSQRFNLELRSPFVEYIFLPLASDEKFNKSYCHNVGALSFPNAKSYIFHDVDTLVPDYFFNFLDQNIREKNYKVMQCFSKRRLLHCDEELTEKILSGEKSIKTLHKFYDGIKEAVPGAQGGSMYIERDLFYNIGGFDTFFTEYSVEDAFFFNKVSVIKEIGFCDTPPIDMFHLHHEPSFNRTTKDEDFQYYYSFLNLQDWDKKVFIEKQGEYLKKFLQ